MTTLLTCAVCGRDWSRGPDDTGDPMVSWLAEERGAVRVFALVCQGPCTLRWESTPEHAALCLFDHHLGWWVGPTHALERLAQVLEDYRWPAELSRVLAAFAVEAAAIPSPKRRRAK